MQSVRDVNTSIRTRGSIGPHSVVGVMRRWLRNPGVMPALVATLALRIASSLFVAFVVSALHDTYVHVASEINLRGASLGLVVVPTPLTGPAQYLTGPWLRWDANEYVTLAAHGYSWYGSTAFLPLYPLLIRLVGTALGGHFVVAALLISTAATFVMFVLLYRLIVRITGSSRVATLSLVVASLLPIAFFFVAPYTESLFLAFALATVLAVMDSHWRRAALFALLATLTRQQGVLLCLLVAPELWLALRRAWHTEGNWRERLREGWRALAGAGALTVAAVGTYALWMLILTVGLRSQTPWQVLTARNAWNQHFTLPGLGLITDLQLTALDPTTPLVHRFSMALDVSAAVLGGLGIWRARKTLPPGLVLYFFACWCVALTKVEASGATNSAARYLLALLPLCLVPASWLARSRPVSRLAYVGCSVVVSCVFLTNWVLWAWVN